MASGMDNVKAYVAGRENGEIDGVLDTVSDAIVFTDASKNVYNGKEEFRKYLQDHAPPSSQWQDPEVVDDDHILVVGKVKKLLMWWDVEVSFAIGADKLITAITVHRK